MKSREEKVGSSSTVPIVNDSKLNTSVTGEPGEEVLVGTMSIPTDSDLKHRDDDGQTQLAYLRVTPLPNPP